MNETSTKALEAYAGLETTEVLTEEQIEAKAQDLLAQLTLDEKIKMMSGDTPFWAGITEMMGGGYNSRAWVAGEVKRLGIPGIRFSDGPRGVVMKGGTTFPVSMARGATFDPDLEEQIGDVIGKEMRAMGANHFGGICINLVRHPAWGRSQETYGEDTYHLGEFGAALTRGVQKHVMACSKHYALNSMENARFTVDVKIDERALHEVYLPHFKRTIDAGVSSVMSSYNSANGEWVGQNHDLLTKILKEEWGFKGYVMTDFIFGMRDSRKAALAGQDIEMPFAMIHNRDLKKLVEAGEVPLSRIDDAALRILREQVRMGMGHDPKDYGPEVIASESNRALARTAAEKSIVLLKNEDNLLPLKDVKRLAVIGKLAATPNTGDAGSSNTLPDYVITPLQGIREAFGADVAVDYDDGSDPEKAAQVAKDADAVILVVGYTSKDEGEYIKPDTIANFAPIFPEPSPEEKPLVEKLMVQNDPTVQTEGFQPDEGGDRELLTLKAHDETLIQAVAAANPRAVVAIMTGSAVITETWRNQVPAIFVLWYPGMEGGRAFADILLGKVNPSGHLPLTFPARAEDLPYYDKDATEITYDLWHGYRKLERDGAQPAFPFGFGLSYTTFQLSDLCIEKAEIAADGTLEAAVNITNTGSVAGEDVVQFFVAVPESQVERAPKELKAFKRVSLEPGETKSITVQIPAKELAYYAPGAGWTVEKTGYQLIAGQDALDQKALRSEFRIE